jgi:apolipoprotein N-acyltransferase
MLLWAAAPLAFLNVAPRAEKITAGVTLLLLPAALVFGILREKNHPPEHRDFSVRIVQPNVSQDDKWRSDNASAIFDGLVQQSLADARGANIRLIVWPESSVPFLLDESAGAREVLRAGLQPGQFLAAGLIRRESKAEDAAFFTSLVVFDEKAEVKGVYDKWRLVPGGEFLPLQWLLEPLGFQKLVSLPGGFSAGGGPQTLDVAGLGLTGALICYEVIFPHRLVDEKVRPQWIINVTNDGWFGASSGPYQHFAQARLRSVEQGLPIIRAANTGISGVIDGLGRSPSVIALGRAGVLDVQMPTALQPTVYSTFGDWLLAGMLTTLALLCSSTTFPRKLS